MLAVIAAVAARVAVRGVVRGNQGRLRLGLGIAVVFGIAALALAVAEIMQQPFGLSDSAYASSFLVILGLMALQTAVALIFALVNGEEYSSYYIFYGTLVFAIVFIGSLRWLYELASGYILGLAGYRRRAVLVGSGKQIEDVANAL